MCTPRLRILFIIRMVEYIKDYALLLLLHYSKLPLLFLRSGYHYFTLIIIFHAAVKDFCDVMVAHAQDCSGNSFYPFSAIFQCHRFRHFCKCVQMILRPNFKIASIRYFLICTIFLKLNFKVTQ